MAAKKECANTDKVRIFVKEIRGGECPLGFKKGDEFLVEGPTIPSGMCAWAWQAIYPFVVALRFKGEIPWEKDRKRASICCPDANNTVVFEINAES